MTDFLSKNEIGTRTAGIENAAREKGMRAVSSFDYKEVCEFFASFSQFRSFGEALVSFLGKHCDTLPEERYEILALLKKKCKEKNIPVSDIFGAKPKDTWESWFGDTIPDEREKGFLLALAMSLDADETRAFMRKAFFDRELDPKNYREIIYYYCIENGYDAAKARELIAKAEISGGAPSEKGMQGSVGQISIYMNRMANENLRGLPEDELLSHCAMLFSVGDKNHNINLKRAAKYWIKKAKEEAWKEMNEADDSFSRIPCYDESDIEPKYDFQTAGKKDISSEALINTIVGFSLYRKENNRNVSTKYSLSFMKKLILRKFPSPDILRDIENDECTSAQLMRNTIIMMKSYCLWRTEKIGRDNANTANDIYMNYVKTVDTTLLAVLAPRLYACNPYDCLFLVSAMCGEYGSPDNFRMLMEEAYDSDLVADRIKKSISADPQKDDYTDLIKAITGENNLIDEWRRTAARNMLRDGRDTAQVTNMLAESFFLSPAHEDDGKSALTDNNPTLWDRFLKDFSKKYGDLLYYIGKYGNPKSADAVHNMPKKRRALQDHGFDGYGAPDDAAEKMAYVICEDAMKEYKISTGVPLEKWIKKKWEYCFLDPRRRKKYYMEAMPQQSISEADEAFYGRFCDMISDETDRAIIKYRFGTDGDVCYVLRELCEKLEKELGINISRDDIIRAEKRFFRLIKRYYLLKGVI